MVRSSSKVSHRRNQQKKKSSLTTQPIEINSESSSSKILHVVRQALLNAAEELISQQRENSIPFQTFDLNKSVQQQNGNSIKKKKKIYRRK